MKKSREELKSYFRRGCRPSEEQFVDLIDSTYNVVDDEITKPIVVEPEEPAPVVEKPTLQEFSANGEWHDISHDKLESGLQLFRAVATYKNSHNSKCYICDVVAAQHDSTSCELSSSKRRWWGWRGPIEFRWRSYLGLLHLQIRCRPMGGYRDRVYCQIVQL